MKYNFSDCKVVIDGKELCPSEAIAEIYIPGPRRFAINRFSYEGKLLAIQMSWTFAGFIISADVNGHACTFKKISRLARGLRHTLNQYVEQAVTIKDSP